MALHLRSGDVFPGHYDKRGSWHPSPASAGVANYGQPTLSFYLRCVSDNLPRFGRAIAVCQDFHNPVCVVLRTIARTLFANTSQSLSVVSLKLDETIATLGCTPVVCSPHSTMKLAYVNSIHTKRHVNSGTEAVIHPEIAPFGSHGWKHSAEQREMLLN